MRLTDNLRAVTLGVFLIALAVVLRFTGLSFTAYFIICTAALLANAYGQTVYGNISAKKRLELPRIILDPAMPELRNWKMGKPVVQLFAWGLVAVCSVAVTESYLHPPLSTATNAAHHVIAINGAESSESTLPLIGPRGLFDDPDFYADNRGQSLNASVAPDGRISVEGNLSSTPLYIRRAGAEGDSLANASQLTPFERQITFAADSVVVTVSLHDIAGERHLLGLARDRDTLRAVVHSQVAHRQGSPTASTDTSAHIIPVRRDFNFHSLIHAGITFNSAVEALMTRLEKVQMIVDGGRRYLAAVPAGVRVTGDVDAAAAAGTAVTLGEGDLLWLGAGRSATRKVSFHASGSGIGFSLQMPLMSHFPRATDSLPERRHNVVLTSLSDSLMRSNETEAFLFNIFHNPANGCNFIGHLSYQPSGEGNPLQYRLTGRPGSDQTHLRAERRSLRWNIGVVDLRTASPLTGKSHWPVRNEVPLTIVLVMCAVAAWSAIACHRSNRYPQASLLLGVWMLMIPLITFRLYLVWRIAAFAPTADIGPATFAAYHLEKASSENAMWITIGVVAALTVISAVAVWLPEVKRLCRVVATRFPGHISLRHVLIAAVVTLAAMYVAGFVFWRVMRVMAAILLFAGCEAAIARYRRGPRAHAAAAAVAFTMLAVADPGYAVLFFAFACVYYALLMFTKFKRSGSTGWERVAFIGLLALLTVYVLVGSKLVRYLFYDTPLVGGLTWLTLSRLLFFLLAGGAALLLYKGLQLSGKWWKVGAVAAVLAVTFAGPVVLNSNRHFKYRALVHEMRADEIMTVTNVFSDDNRRLIEASQNQWFIEYQNKRGRESSASGRMYSLEPHFQKGVTYPTQITDVVLSRYVVGEISPWLPFAIIALGWAFVVMMLLHTCRSAASQRWNLIAALLIAVQMTFVWLSCTNRTIFFGQDFPMLSHNARFTTAMFVVLLAGVLLGCRPAVENDLLMPMHENAKDGLRLSIKSRPKYLLIAAAAFIGFVYLFGNNYDRLYPTGDNGSRAYNMNQLISNSRADFNRINAILSEQPSSIFLRENQNISSEFDRLDRALNLTARVDSMDISDFTRSLYKAFAGNYKRCNSQQNLIHLRRSPDRRHLEFALNENFYTLTDPESPTQQWAGNIIGFGTAEHRRLIGRSGNVIGISHQLTGGDSDIRIVDLREQHRNGTRYRCLDSSSSFETTLPLFAVTGGASIEAVDSRNGVTPVRLAADAQPSILAKGMVVNGTTRHFYPLGTDCFWARHAAQMFAVENGRDTGDREVTLDVEFTRNVARILSRYRFPASVVMLDQDGYVRLMADHRPRRADRLDPNDEEGIAQRLISAYLNPDPNNERPLLGNMNLTRMVPGPGSSLKPVTYAAMISRMPDFDWNALRLAPAGSNVERTAFGALTMLPRRPFRSVRGDENPGDAWIDNIFYLSHSSNYYNGMLTYLGLFDNTEEMREATRAGGDRDFPLFRVPGSESPRAFARPPALNRPMLFNALTANLNLRYTDHPDSVWTDDFFSISGRNLRQRYTWAFAEPSAILRSELHSHPAGEQLRRYAIGTDPIHVTPMMMAEMYGRIFTGNTAYHARIMPGATLGDEPWTDAAGNPIDALQLFARYNLFSGMAQCAAGGTARARGLQPFDGLHTYAKTGTLNLQGRPSDNMMAVVITNHDMTQPIDNPRELRFVVLYVWFVQPSGIDHADFWNRFSQAFRNSTTYRNTFNSRTR